MGKSQFISDWAFQFFDTPRQRADASASEPDERDSLAYTAFFSEGRFILSFGNMARFAVCFETRCIELLDCDELTDSASLDHLLYDHVLPRVIAAGGPLVLHGSAVKFEECLALFIGETGAGKSTLSASLYRAGHHLLGDDAVVVTETNGVHYGEAVYPSLRLYPETVARVLGEDIPTAPMAHYSDKRHVIGLDAANGAALPLPVGCVFILDKGEAAPSLVPISPREACMALIEQSFALDPNDGRSAAARMQQAGALASAVAAYKLVYRHDFEDLPQVHELITEAMAKAAREMAALHPSEGNAP